MIAARPKHPRIMTTRPLDPAHAASSSALHRLIGRNLAAGGNWLSFAGFMEIALYAPLLGYYAGGSRKFGAAGDFVTAPEMTPLFAAALAVQAAEFMRSSAPSIVEVGAGSGRLAVDLLVALEHAGTPPDDYAILELSGELAARQRSFIDATLPSRLARRVRWLDTLPEDFCGVVIANEVLDAMPVHVLRWQRGAVFERGVAGDAEGRLVWAERAAEGRLLAAARDLADAHALPEGYVSELGLAAPAWVAAWGEKLRRGALLLIDYGFPAHEFYHPQRAGGTLMCHYRHRAHADPLINVGRQDITAHVDFTAVADAAHTAGFSVAGYTAQATFLMNCGILDRLAELPEASVDTFRAKAAVQKLLSPAEMGELFKVIALTKGMPAAGAPVGFASGDRRWRL